MATVTGMTAAAMQAIRDGTIVNGTFDSASHLILTKYDGTQIDAGAVLAATTGQAGVVELATSAETQSGTDTTRAITPAGLASLPGYRVQLMASNQLAESALPASWPYGVSLQNCTTGSGWSLMSGFGTVVTYSIITDRTFQMFYSSNGGTSPVYAWTRTYHTTTGGGGWTPWQQNQVTNNLVPASFTQTTVMASYPLGSSRIYYTTANSTSWDFTGLAGEVNTYSDGVFARQTFTQHVGGSSKPSQWFRTATVASSWTAWQSVLTDPGAWLTWTPAWTTSSGIHTPVFNNAVLDCRYNKIARQVEVKFEITFGSTTNFGATPATGDNWQFSMPVAPARVGDTIGWVELKNSNDIICMGRARIATGNLIMINISTGRADAIAIANTGDVDSVSPWTWASTHSVKGVLSYESAA